MKVLTHYDLDGIVSGIILYNYFLEKNKILENNKDIIYLNYSDSLENFINYIKDENLIFTDLNLELDLLKKCLENNNKILLYIDHHDTNYNNEFFSYVEKQKEKIKNFFINKSKSASLILFEKLKFKKERLRKLVELTNIYDTYQVDNENFLDAENLNFLFWKYKEEKFFNKFQFGFRNFDEEDKIFVEDFQNRKSEILKRLEIEKINLKDKIDLFYLNKEEKFVVNIIPYYFKTDIAFIINDTKEGFVRFSIRINKNFSTTINDLILIIENDNRLKEKIVGIGGHEKVGGMTIKIEENFNEIIDFFKILINKIGLKEDQNKIKGE